MSHDRLERLRQLNRTRFKRHTGIYPETFAEMEIVLDQRERSKKKSGRPPALNTAQQLLLTLEFWREYRTFAHLGHDWDIHKTTVQRTVERVETALIHSGEFRLPGRKSLKQEENVFQIIAVDAAETPCERPTSQQRRWYSGKKKRHTLKTQVVIDVSTRMILCVATAFGSMHDLTLFRQSGVQIHPETALIGDAGYQGIRQHHGHSVTPHKATKKAPLTPEQSTEPGTGVDPPAGRACHPVSEDFPRAEGHVPSPEAALLFTRQSHCSGVQPQRCRCGVTFAGGLLFPSKCRESLTRENPHFALGSSFLKTPPCSAA